MRLPKVLDVRITKRPFNHILRHIGQSLIAARGLAADAGVCYGFGMAGCGLLPPPARGVTTFPA